MNNIQLFVPRKRRKKMTKMKITSWDAVDPVWTSAGTLAGDEGSRQLESTWRPQTLT